MPCVYLINHIVPTYELLTHLYQFIAQSIKSITFIVQILKISFELTAPFPPLPQFCLRFRVILYCIFWTLEQRSRFMLISVQSMSV